MRLAHLWAGKLLELLVQLGARVPALRQRYALNERLPGAAGEENCHSQSRVWLHGASLGEIKGVLSLIKVLDTKQGPFVISTQKREVRDWMHQHHPQIPCVVAPLPTESCVESFLHRFRVRALVLYEAELWPAWVACCKARKLPVALVSAREGVYNPLKWFLWKLFLATTVSSLDFVSCATAGGARRLKPFVRGHFGVGGDFKLLALNKELLAAPKNRVSESGKTPCGTPKKWEIAMISVHLAEWKYLKNLVAPSLARGQAVILLPRRLGQSEQWKKHLKGAGFNWVDWPGRQQGSVTMVEQWGLVSQVLAESYCGIMGGSYCRVGTHNFWEVLGAGIPVLIGPNAGDQEAVLRSWQRLGLVSRHQLPTPGAETDLRIFSALRRRLQRVMVSVRKLDYWLSKIPRVQ